MFRLYEKAVTMVANQRCGMGRGNWRESRVRSETYQGYKEPILFFLFLNYCVRCGPDIRNLLGVDRMF